MMDDSSAAAAAHRFDADSNAGDSFSPTTLTLSHGGVDFSLLPSTAESAIDFRRQATAGNHNQNEIMLNLTSFTGTLRVCVSQMASTSSFAPTTTKLSSVSADSTPKATHVSSAKRSRALADVEATSTGLPILDSPSLRKKPYFPSQSQFLSPVEEREEDTDMVDTTASTTGMDDGTAAAAQNLNASLSQATTLLGQPDFSQTQATQTSMYTTTTMNGDHFDDHHATTTPHFEDDNDTDNAANQQKERTVVGVNNEEVAEPSVVEQIMMEGTSCSPSPADKDDDDDSVSSVRLRVGDMTESTVVMADVLPPPARVSLGGSPLSLSFSAKKIKMEQGPPCPRWGHAMTAIGDGRILMYGGQTTVNEDDEDHDRDRDHDSKTTQLPGLPRTLQDVYIYDTNLETWTKPFNCDGMPRQWHTATFLPDRQLLISFGGEAIAPVNNKSKNNKKGNSSNNKKCKTTDQVMVLDTEIMLWYPPTVSGDVPSGRSGHTATLLHKTSELIVFGGVKGSKWLNMSTVSCLDTLRWKWRTPKVQGTAPKPRSYHTATALPDNRVVVFGGNDATQSFATVHVLETSSAADSGDSGGAEANNNNNWQWTHPKVMGRTPASRTGHSATLLADKKTICIYGGWDPNSDEDDAMNNDGDEHMFFQDSYLLDTEKWVWRQGPPVAAAETATSSHDENDQDFGPKRVGHTAVLSKGGTEVLVFGGRVPQDRFAGDFQRLVVSSSSNSR
jgi:hypothetical protein